MNTKGKILTLVVGIIVMVVFFGSAVEDYFKDRAISVNPAVVNAKIVDTQKTTKRKKGVTRTSYDFIYEFEVKGEKYRGEFGASEANAQPYLAQGTVSIMYNVDDPSKKDLQVYVDTNKTVMDLVWGFVKSLLFALLLGFIIGGIVSHKLGWLRTEEKSKDDEAPDALEA